MTTITLIIHITLSVLSLISAGLSAMSTKNYLVEKAISRLHAMWAFTGSAVVTGFGLSFMTHSPITQTCLSSITLIAAVSFAQVYKTFAFSKN